MNTNFKVKNVQAIYRDAAALIEAGAEVFCCCAIIRAGMLHRFEDNKKAFDLFKSFCGPVSKYKSSWFDDVGRWFERRDARIFTLTFLAENLPDIIQPEDIYYD